MPAIDFSDVKGLDPVPQGTYNASIVFAEPGKSASGNPKIDLRWKVEGGEFDGRLIFDTLSFHPNALFRVKNTLQALGWSKDFKGEVLPEDLIGQTATLVVTIEESSGTNDEGEPYPPRNRVTKVKPLSASISGLLS